jgi:hypothetical protein
MKANTIGIGGTSATMQSHNDEMRHSEECSGVRCLPVASFERSSKGSLPKGREN